MLDIPTLPLCAALSAWACSPTFVLAVVVYALLQIMDVASTLRAINAGGQEANPICRWFMGWLGNGPGMLVVKALVFWVMFVLSPHVPADQLLWGLWVVNAIYIAVVVHNLRVASHPGGDA